MARFYKECSTMLFFSIIMLICTCSENVVNNEPSGITTESTGTSYVRFIHSAASEERIDIYYLDNTSNSYEGFIASAEYGKQYGYYDFYSGLRSFKVTFESTNFTAAIISEELQDQEKYSIVAVDLDATIDPSLLVIQDTTATPAPDKSFVRFIHASADAPNLNILDNDNVLITENLSQNQSSPYYEVEAGTYTYRAVSSGSANELPQIDTITLISGVTYTAILSGSTGVLPGPQFNIHMYPESSVAE